MASWRLDGRRRRRRWRLHHARDWRDCRGVRWWRCSRTGGRGTRRNSGARGDAAAPPFTRLRGSVRRAVRPPDCRSPSPPARPLDIDPEVEDRHRRCPTRRERYLDLAVLRQERACLRQRFAFDGAAQLVDVDDRHLDRLDSHRYDENRPLRLGSAAFATTELSTRSSRSSRTPGCDAWRGR